MIDHFNKKNSLSTLEKLLQHSYGKYEMLKLRSDTIKEMRFLTDFEKDILITAL